MSVFHNNALIGAGGGATAAAGDVATKSLRFNPTDSAYLSRTPSSAGNRRTWTVSLWLKRSKLGTNNQHVLETASSPEYSGLWFAQDDSLEFRGFNGSSYTYRLHTSQRFRDPGAWYHIVLNFDSTAATASDRLAMYVNGVKVEDFDNTVYPSLNHDSNWNNTSTHYIATFVASTNYFGGYIADLYSIDGSILGPTSFGAFDDNGVWQAAAYSGTYGTNGFHLLDFENESTIGHDSSGNNNDFTAVNLSDETTTLPGVNFTSSTSDYLSHATSTDFDFTGDFTVECYVKITAYNASGASTIAGTGSGSWSFGLSNTGKCSFGHYGVQGFFSGGASVLAGVWTHVAVARSGSSVKGFINGVQEVSTTYSASMSNSNALYIGNDISNSSQHFNGVISNLNIVKGTALYTSNFSPPTAPLSAHANTKLLCCQSSSSTTATAVAPGTLSSNGSPSAGNFSDSGFNADVLFDVPTNDTENTDSGAGGEISGNYAVWNPLSGATTLSNGNLVSNGTGGHNQCLSTIGMSSGKWYFETTIVDNTDNQGVGIALKPEPGTFVGNTTSGYLYYGNGTKRHNTTNTSFANSFTVGDVIGIAFDADGGNLYFYKNGAVQGSGAAAFTGLTSGPYFFTVDQYATSAEIAANFGQRAFAYSAPSGYKALCTTNLPTPTIADGSEYFQPVLWDGNSSARSITTTGMSPDWVWIKARNHNYWHYLYDAVRGATKEIYANSPNAEDTDAGGLTAFNSDGFSLGSNVGINGSSKTFVGFAWNAGANSNKTYTVTVVSDSGNKYRFDGHGTSAVTLDLAEGSTYVFDQSDSSNSGHPLRFSTTSDGTHNSGSEYTTGVTATGTPGSAGAKTTIVIPAGTIYSDLTSGGAVAGSYPMSQSFDGSTSTAGVRAVSGGGFVFGGSLGISYSSSVRVHSGASGIGTQQFKLNDGTATDMAENTFVTVASGSGTLNKLEITAGSTGNANIYLGAVEVDGVILQDNSSTPTLYYYCSSHSGMGGQANTNSTAGSTRLSGEFNSSVYNQSQNWSSNYSSSNGFAGAAANAFDGNVSTESYASANGGVLTMTFSPSLSGEIVMDIPNGGTFKNSSTDATIGSFSGGIWTYTASNLPGIKIEQTGGRPNPRQVKLDGKILVDSTATPPSVPSINSVVKTSAASGFSIVSYTGNGTAGTTIGHALNAVPELILLKSRDTQASNSSWTVHHSVIAATKNLILNDTAAAGTTGSWNDTAPGSSVFTVGSAEVVNTSSKKYIAYCFSSVAGFSKVGSFINPSSSDSAFVFCGFRPAFLLAKCAENISSSSGTGDWIIKDSKRSPFNDPSDGNTLVANVANAEDNYYNATQAAVDFLSNGFKIRHNNTSPLGDPGRRYVFIAFAENPFQANGGLAR